MKKLTKKVLNAYLKKMRQRVLDIYISDDKQSAICTTYDGSCWEWWISLPAMTVERQMMSTVMLHELNPVKLGWEILENMMEEI